MQFRSREEAGEQLADILSKKSYSYPVVYTLPRGGVAVGTPIAERLHSPLDLVITRKIGHPGNPEYAVCSVSEGGRLLCNESERERLPAEWLESERVKAKAEASRRRRAYSGGKPMLSPRGRTAIIVDDGVATGLTLRLALQEIQDMRPERLVAAVPVLPPDAARVISCECDELVSLFIDPAYRGAVGAYYDEFPQLTDDDVIALMNSVRNA